MNQILLAQAVKFLAELILGSSVFNQILASVEAWDAKQIAGAEKKTGVAKDIEILGLNLTNSMSNLAIELAVAYVGYKAGNNAAPTKASVVNQVENTVMNTVSNTVSQVSNT